MVLDKVTQYIKIPENGIAGQDARSKEWYCKELPFSDADDLETRAQAVITVLNKLNKPIKAKKEKEEKKLNKK